MRSAGEGPVSQRGETQDATDRARPRVSLALGNALAFAVDGGLQAAADARSELTDHLAPRLDPETVEVAQLLLSELVTNCVLHGAASRPGVWIDVTVSLFPRVLSVEVSDGGPSFDHQSSQAPAEAVAGRGLYLVDQLSARWGIGGGRRGRVWFELRRAA
jgi:anti-sigma regulatory factor (Ser/Thr protein kinase)